LQQASATIVNRLGLHARAASKLVKLARRFDSQLEVGFGSVRADAKNIMSVMLLAAPMGSILTLTVSGHDEVDALAAISALIADRFGEPE
jgi:phosphocarrier protein HPr